jgi:2-polyprenyl-3-methyl-5-hydroxy-6-metoxy-1,4-benzoquinol methylase
MSAAPAESMAPPCLACGSRESSLWARATDGEYRATDEMFRYLRCAACGVLFIDPVPRSRLAEIYPSNYYSFANPSDSLVQRIKRRLDARLFRRLLRRVSGKSLSVLDVGGGAGWELSWLRDLDPRIRSTQVVDLDPGAEQTARANGHDYFCGRVEDFATDKKFDLVLLLNLIEHVEDPGAVLRKMRALLSPDGLLLIKTPNTDSLDARLFRHHNWAGYHCPRHWVLFARPSLTALAETSGLQVTEFRYTQGAPFWAASIIFRLFAASVTKERPVVLHRLFGPLCALFAAFDLLRQPFAKPSQMLLTARPAALRDVIDRDISAR